MDPSRFDHLIRLLGHAGGRRAVVGAIFGALTGPSAVAAARKRRRERGETKANDRDDEREQRMRAEAGKRRRKSRKKRRGGSDGGQPEPPPTDCCGTESCPDPERGSTSANCNFAARAFVGQNHNGSAFRGIDGRGANFNHTDNRGSIFAEACLQGASFRGATLGGSTWGDACLFDADFTGADFRGDLTLFDEARFCNTIMPSGAVNDRDCGSTTACCQHDAQPEPVCTPACLPGLRCAANGRCVCDDQSCPNGCCFSDSGGSICLNGEVNAFCGSGGETCADCGAGAECLGQVCVCRAGLCAGCCENGPDNPGRCLANEPPVCGVDGAQCTSCPAGDGRTCNAQGACVCNVQSCPNGCCSDGAGNPGICVERQCTRDNDCPNVRDCVCDQVQGTCCGRNCDGKVCGPDGCGGDCENLCPANTVCNDDGTACLCTAQSCPTGCCSNGLGNPGTCLPGNTNQDCGLPGSSCQTCTGQELCQNRQCVCVPKTCAELGRSCGPAPDGCGGTLSCGTCDGASATPSCSSDGVCTTCTVTCPGCDVCLILANGDTRCGEFGFTCQLGCSSNADCTDPEAPLCAVSYNDPSGTTTFASMCGPGVVNVCTASESC